MKLCSKCSEFVSLKDILLNTPRLNATLIKHSEKCDECGRIL